MRSPARPSRRTDPDAGQVSVLIVGMAVILLLLVSVVLAATQAFVQRRTLAGWADGAALAAAQQVAHAPIYQDGLGGQLVVDQASAQRAVTEYLARMPSTGGLDSVAVAALTVDPAAGWVSVRLQGQAQVPLLTPVTQAWGAGIPVAATARVVLEIR